MHMVKIFKSIDIANLFIKRYGKSSFLTNLKLNKLVYYAQVEALREDGVVLFDDPIQAWGYGPVEPEVYHSFSWHGRSRIQTPYVVSDQTPEREERATHIVDKTWEHYGFLTAYDLVTYSHRDGSAWQKTFNEQHDVEITVPMIKGSKDFSETPTMEKTLANGIKSVDRSFPNALRLLKDA